SDKELSFQILQTEAFKGPDGKFNRELYDRVLKSDGLSQAKFESQLRQDLTLRKLRSLVIDSVELPDAIAKSKFSAIATEIEVRYVAVSSAQFSAEVETTPEQIATELQDNDADIRAQYDEDLTRLYQLPERFRIERIVKNIGAESDVEALKTELESAKLAYENGEQFGALALQYSETTQPLTPLNATQLGPEAVQALEAIQDGELTSVVETAAGLQLIKRLAKLPATEISYDDAKEDIARMRIKDRQSPELAKVFAETILKDWKSTGNPPAESIGARNISVERPDAFPKGNSAIPGLSGNIEFETALKAMTEAGLMEQVFSTENTYYILEVLSLTPPTDEDFQSIGRYYAAQMKSAQKQSALDAWNQELLTRTSVEKLFNPLSQ
ncbi:MAG: peptidylprolyl isomerase, partial [Myxococcota bacterium]|nr:peptidylprolyl isomerase [Myxococcota bacterium]